MAFECFTADTVSSKEARQGSHSSKHFWGYQDIGKTRLSGGLQGLCLQCSLLSRKILLVSLLHENALSKMNCVQQEFFKQYLAAGMVSGRAEQAGSCSLEHAHCQRGSSAHFGLLNNMNPFVEWLIQQQVIKK